MKSDQVLSEKKIAIMATHGFEEIELTAPLDELREYGAMVHLISDEPTIRSFKNKTWGNEFKTDKLLDAVQLEEYDMLILPGGVINADKLRRNDKAMEMLRAFHATGKTIAAICHGPQLLIEADLVGGRTATSHRAIRTDMVNAGANFEDHGVVREGNLITAQGVQDISAFMKKIIDVLKVTS